MVSAGIVRAGQVQVYCSQKQQIDSGSMLWQQGLWQVISSPIAANADPSTEAGRNMAYKP